MLILVAATALSCGDDDNNSTGNTNAGLVGTWKLSALYYGNSEQPVTACMRNTLYKFNADNTMHQTISMDNASGACNVTNYDGVYVVSGNTLTVTTTGSLDGFEIVTLNSTKLRLSVISGGGDTADAEYTRQ